MYVIEVFVHFLLQTGCARLHISFIKLCSCFLWSFDIGFRCDLIQRKNCWFFSVTFPVPCYEGFLLFQFLKPFYVSNFLVRLVFWIVAFLLQAFYPIYVHSRHFNFPSNCLHCLHGYLETWVALKCLLLSSLTWRVAGKVEKTNACVILVKPFGQHTLRRLRRSSEYIIEYRTGKVDFENRRRMDSLRIVSNVGLWLKLCWTFGLYYHWLDFSCPRNWVILWKLMPERYCQINVELLAFKGKMFFVQGNWATNY